MKVVIADSKPEIRSALRLLLTQEPDMCIADEAHDVVSLLDATRTHNPTLVLVDWELADPRPAGARGASLTDEIAARAPHARVVVLSGRPETRAEALDAGAHAFVCKCNSPDHLIAVLRAMNGRD